MIKKIFVSVVCFLMLFFCFIVFTTWRSPGPYVWFAKKSFDFAGSRDNRRVVIHSMGNFFDVDFIKNMPEDSSNPYFPGIRIVANDECNAWLQIVRTDAKYQQDLRCFIDSWPEGYPFYTKENVFVDQPIWIYSLFSKPLSYWKAHAYAVHVDVEKKTIKCLGGVSWGYQLAWWWLRPIMIEPNALDQASWQVDWDIFQKQLQEYENL